MKPLILFILLMSVSGSAWASECKTISFLNVPGWKVNCLDERIDELEKKIDRIAEALKK